MITRKQYPNHHVYEMEIGGRAFTVETGKVAELANAECICRYGDTVVLTTCTCNPIPNDRNCSVFPRHCEPVRTLVWQSVLF